MHSKKTFMTYQLENFTVLIYLQTDPDTSTRRSRWHPNELNSLHARVAASDSPEYQTSGTFAFPLPSNLHGRSNKTGFPAEQRRHFLKMIGRALMLIFTTSKPFLPCNAIGIMLKFRNYW